MSRWPILFAITVFAFSSASALPLCAQIGGPLGYQPSPALSPWLGLYQRQGGPVDNYHMYVQPQLQLGSALQSQQMGIQGNTAAVNAMGDRFVSQSEAAYAAPIPTGVAASFFTQGAYFNTYRGGMGAVGGTPGTAPGLNRPNAGNTGFGGGLGTGFGAGLPAVPSAGVGGFGRGGVL
jgi:hypothetical protein